MTRIADNLTNNEKAYLAAIAEQVRTDVGDWALIKVK
jgi:hypothetical protein